MYRYTRAYYSLILLFLFLSCRSEAQTLDPSVDDKKVESAIGQVEVDVPATSASAQLDTEAVLAEEVVGTMDKLEKEVTNTQETEKTQYAPSKVINTESKGEVIQVEVVPPEIDKGQSNVSLPNVQSQEEKEVIAEIVVSPQESPVITSPSEAKIGNEVERVNKTTIKEEVGAKEVPPAEIASIHDAWDILLKKYVSESGYVDYKGLKEVSHKLDAYMKVMASNQPKDSDLSDDAMAYYINLYNAATVKLILDNYPTASIRDINGGKPWGKEWISVGGKTYSLNNIEHDILRPRFKDSRVHFAVNCASASCPKIVNRAFYGSDLDMLLDELTKGFVNDRKLNTIDAKAAELSKIFLWYQGDFDSVVDFVNQYANVKMSASTKITYKDYKWNLNGK